MESSLEIIPRISVLTPEAIEQVHEYSLKILSEIGIRVDSEKANLLLSHSPGVKLVDDQQVTFQPELVEWAIHQAPSVVEIFNRKGDLVIRLGDDDTRFGIGVTNLFYQSPQNDEIIPFSRAHMRSSVGLGNVLQSFDLISTIGILRDVDIEIADLVSILEMAAGTEKPLVILVSDESQFLPGIHLLEQLVGDLSSKPWVIPYFNPVTPLIMNQSTVDNMLVSIEKRIPFIYSNYGMAGISTPITSAGTLTLLNAELLAGLVFSQIIRPGTPIILGSLPAFFDMKMMVDFFDPQTMLLNLACAEMMAHYKIPHAGTSGSANGWGLDLISSQTLCINQLTSCLGKVGLAPFVGGSFGSKVFSPAPVVYANEIIEQSRQFSKGFKMDDQLLAFDEMKKIGIGGNFISSRQTMSLFRDAYHFSSIFPRMSLEKWLELGQPEAMKLVQEKTIELINRGTFPENQAEIIKKGEYLISHRKRLLH